MNYSTCLLNMFFSFVDFELKRDLMLVLSKQRKFLITLKEFCKNLWKNQQGLKIMHCKLMKFKWRPLLSFRRLMRYEKDFIAQICSIFVQLSDTLSWCFAGAVKIWCREAYSWCNQFSLQSHSSSERAGLFCAHVHTIFSNFFIDISVFM